MTDRIRFLFNGRVQEVTDIDPTMTVLTYLRTVARCVGSKEGCAEGDCGACTVVVTRLRNDALEYRAVNACILFLPVLDGKQLITVEQLKASDGSLHPAQRAMVDCHGSQCGFCTPGFVMSLFALFHSEERPTRKRINDVLAGNLCRCTGYSPIVDAAERMYAAGREDQFSEREADTCAILESLRRTEMLAMSWKNRRYFAPSTVAEVAVLCQRHPDAHVLAGGTDVGLWVTKDHRDLDTIVYLGDVPELQRCEVSASHIEIGAAATYTDVSDAIGRFYPDFAEIIRRLGAVQIRNTGTMVGNVANASPIGDSMPPLMVLGSSVRLRRGTDTREVSLDDFFVDYRQTVLREGEFIESLRIPVHAPSHLFGAYKVSKRFDQDISAVLGAYGLRLEDGRVNDIRICYGGMAAVPKRATACEEALLGVEWNREAVHRAVETMHRDFTPISDMRATHEYRLLVAKNLLRRFYLETTSTGAPMRVLEYVE